MNVKIKLLILAISITTLQGCSKEKNNTHQSKVVSSDYTVPQEGVANSQLPFLEQCLVNSKELSKSKKIYKKQHEELIVLIKEAKLYASANLSESINQTITPFFEYKINYACNKISQGLIEEYSSRIQKTSTFSGDK